MRHAKAANISDQYSQLTWAFNAIAPEIRRNIEALKEIISVASFLKQLENKRDTWHQIYSRKFESSYNKSYGGYQPSYSKRYDHDAHEKSSQTGAARGKSSQKLLPGPEKNERKTSRPNQPPNGDDRKGKTQEATPPWKDRAPSDEYSGGRGGYRQNRYDKNRGGYQNKDRDYDRKRYKDKYREKTRDYERPDTKSQDARSQKAYTNSYEYGDPYADGEPYEKIDPNEKYDDEESEDQYSYNVTMKSPGVCKKCGIPKKKFKSNNLFHSHIRGCKRKPSKPVVQSPQTPVKIPNLPVIESTAPSTIGNGLGFRSYHFAMIWIMVDLLKPIEAVADTGCAVSLIDEDYFRKILPDENVIKMAAPINVKDIENAHKKCDTYVLLALYLDGESKGVPARGYFRREVHVIKNLKCKLLLEMDILEAEQVTINLTNKTMVIPTCKDLVVPIRIAPKPNARIRRVVHSKDQAVIPPKSVAQVPTYMKSKPLPDDRDYLFEPNQQQLTASLRQLGGFYTHVCHGNVAGVHVRNDKNMTVRIPRRARLGTLTEYETKGCYQVDDEYHEVAVVSNIQDMEA